MKCGEPLSKETVGHGVKGQAETRWRSVNSARHKYKARHEYEETQTNKEKWLVNVGRGQFFRILTFEGSQLVKIEMTKTRRD